MRCDSITSVLRDTSQAGALTSRGACVATVAASSPYFLVVPFLRSFAKINSSNSVTLWPLDLDLDSLLLLSRWRKRMLRLLFFGVRECLLPARWLLLLSPEVCLGLGDVALPATASWLRSFARAALASSRLAVALPMA